MMHTAIREDERRIRPIGSARLARIESHWFDRVDLATAQRAVLLVAVPLARTRMRP